MENLRMLTREEMKQIMAGKKDKDTLNCEEYYELSGCCPAAGGNQCDSKGKIWLASVACDGC